MRDPLPANFGKPWTKAEDEKVMAAFRAGASVHEIARDQARTQSLRASAARMARRNQGRPVTLAQELARCPKLRRRPGREYVRQRLAEIRATRNIAFLVENDRSAVAE